MANKLKVMTILGTRPEIIRLAETIKACDKYFNHILVHTGQNYDYELIFIDNDSKDKTRELIEKQCNSNKKVKANIT